MISSITTIRDNYRLIRQQLSKETLLNASRGVVEFLDHALPKGEKIGLFLSLDELPGELDLSELSLRLGPLAYSSRVVSFKRREMEFYHVLSGERLRDISELKIILVPGVVFDLAGHRFGSGYGFYDRALAESPNIEKWGITHSIGLYTQGELPTEPWDVKMNRVVTEHGFAL